jgi:hypothetical protein
MYYNQSRNFYFTISSANNIYYLAAAAAASGRYILVNSSGQPQANVDYFTDSTNNTITVTEINNRFVSNEFSLYTGPPFTFSIPIGVTLMTISSSGGDKRKTRSKKKAFQKTRKQNK